MIDFLYRLDVVTLFLVISLIFISISIFALIFFKRFLPQQFADQDNAVVGNVSNLISLIYGVLAGLTALYLINNISYAADAVQREANAVVDIYREATWLKQPMQNRIKNHLKQYINTVIEVEWPLMREGKMIDDHADFTIEEVDDALKEYDAKNQSEALLVRDMQQEIKALYDARQQRIQLSSASLNAEIWIVIMLGTILMVAINYFYTVNVYMHILCIIAVALMASAMSFLLLVLDRPFQGEFVIEPVAFKSVIHFIDKHSNHLQASNH
jgi:hypothetical protein